MTERESVIVCTGFDLPLVYNGQQYNLNEFVSSVEKAMETIPEKYRDGAYFHANTIGDFQTVTISYVRPETDEEKFHRLEGMRMENERKMEDARYDNRMAHFRKEYERMKRMCD